MAGEKHKQEVWSEFPQSSLSPWDKDTILLQGGCQMELTEKVPLKTPSGYDLSMAVIEDVSCGKDGTLMKTREPGETLTPRRKAQQFSPTFRMAMELLEGFARKNHHH